MNERKYRIRRSFLGKAILQRLVSSPSLINGVVDSSIRTLSWEDVDYDTEPYSEFYPDREKGK